MVVSSLILLPMMMATSMMATLSISMTTMVAFLATTSTATNYCSITPKHTMCQYQGLGKACGGNSLRRGVTEDERKEIVDVHNMVRGKLARGEERRGRPGPQPAAANMRLMEWDDELAT